MIIYDKWHFASPSFKKPLKKHRLRDAFFASSFIKIIFLIS